MSTTTITIRIPTEVQDKLARLSKGTRRSRSFLAAEAVAAYVDRELAIVDGLQQGLDDAAAGRVISHEDAMAQVHVLIDEAQHKRAAHG